MIFCKVFTRNFGPPSATRLLLFLIAVFFISCGTNQAAPEPEVIFVHDTEPVEVPIEIPHEPLPPLIETVSIPGGNFRMGSPEGTFRNHTIPEFPVHQVTVRNFSLGKYEVTQGQYYEIMDTYFKTRETRPSQYRNNPEDTSPEGWKNLPVEMVNWYEALMFCNALSMREGLDPVYRINGSTNPGEWGKVPSYKEGKSFENLKALTAAAIQRLNISLEEIKKRQDTWDELLKKWDSVEMISGANGYRLPTEAEWEYAARGGKNSKGFNFAGGNSSRDPKINNNQLSIDNLSWYPNNSDHKTHEIGKKTPNELGLYDMSGNVMEWCWDWQGNYTANSQDNPVGPPVSPHTAQPVRIIRGGGFSVALDYHHVAFRHSNTPYYQGINLGFRVARWE